MAATLEELVVHHATVVDADGERPNSWVHVRGGVIAAVGTGEAPQGLAGGSVAMVDFEGDRLAPGFVDLHCHGGGGHGFDGDDADTGAALQFHQSKGTAYTVASLVTAPIEVLERQLRSLSDRCEVHPGLLGAHLEGPFLAPARKGAHAHQHLRHPSEDLVSRLLIAGRGVLRQITIAPELPGALDAIARFVDAGVAVAVGHSVADHDMAQSAFDRGATLMTHAFNAMAPIGGRTPGPLVAAINDDRITLEVIADGVHVDPASIAMLCRAAPGRVAFVTDAIAASGAADGAYHLGDLDVTVSEGRALLAGTDTIAGSVATQDVALRLMVAAGVSIVDVVTALTVTPAQAVGRRRDQHVIAPGAPAALVRLDGSLSVSPFPEIA